MEAASPGPGLGDHRAERLTVMAGREGCLRTEPRVPVENLVAETCSFKNPSSLSLHILRRLGPCSKIKQQTMSNGNTEAKGTGGSILESPNTRFGLCFVGRGETGLKKTLCKGEKYPKERRVYEESIK